MVVMMKATRGTRDPDLLGLIDFEFLLNDSSSGIWTWSQVVSGEEEDQNRAGGSSHAVARIQRSLQQTVGARFKPPCSWKDYQIDCGDGKRVHERADMAEGLLFSWVSEEVSRKPTFARFCSLLDNYNPNEGYKEVVTEEERQEQAAFIEEISRTSVIKYLHRYLVLKDVAPGSYLEFKRMLTSLWFDLYGRGGTSGSSSAFEHVFVGEIKQSGGNKSLDSITGFR
nr:probable serine proteinase - Arabidopsis thaliana [Arabidopsis thaliana]